MTNVLSVLPEFDIKPFAHVLPALEKALVSTADLLTLDALDVAKRAQLPPVEVKKLADALLHTLQTDLDVPGFVSHGGTEAVFEGDPNAEQTGSLIGRQRNLISTLDERLDHGLGGGIARGRLTEVVGESAAGKTQMLLTLLLSVQLSTISSGGKSALYISTEAPLQTTRLTQILSHHLNLCDLGKEEIPTLSRIHSTHIHDVEAQEHILRYQVPVAIKKQNIGLLVIDSIAANYRAEFDKNGMQKGAASFAKRSAQVSQLGVLLRDIAQTHNIAVVVANQVADRFTVEVPAQGIASQSTQRSRPASPPQSLPNRSATFSQNVNPEGELSSRGLSTDDPLALDHQQRFFTGWGDDPAVTNYKTPSLGLTWSNQLAARIALLKEPIYDTKQQIAGEERSISGWKRTAKVVFSTWGPQTAVDFQISEGGVRSISKEGDTGG